VNRPGVSSSRGFFVSETLIYTLEGVSYFMPDMPVSLIVNEPLASLLKDEMRKRGETDAATLIRDILLSYFEDSGSKSQEGPGDRQEYLELRVEGLKTALKRKDQEISALLEMWHMRLGKEGGTLTREEEKVMEEKIAQIQRDWYYDQERRDFSGADIAGGSDPSDQGSARHARKRPDQEA
jgi:hypothetical protein